jgi:RNA polymerase-binding transcription factor DksA
MIRSVTTKKYSLGYRATEEVGFFCCLNFARLSSTKCSTASRGWVILILINFEDMTSQKLIEENKKKLLDEQKRIRGILNREDIKDGPGEFPGEYKPKYDEMGREDGENASEVENFQNQLSVTKDLEARLEKVKAALDRIENETYGKCQMGDEIDEARLRAEPAADTCINHSK